jgi:hypothetical protein
MVDAMSLVSEGWHHWLSEPAPEGVLIEIGTYLNGQWIDRRLIHGRRLLSELGESGEGRYWRWTGIGREEYADSHPHNPHERNWRHWAIN